jgi:DNA-binding transcriptional LysR family regulator
VELQLLARGADPASITRFDSNAIIHALVAAGEFVAIVPALVLDADDPRIAVYPLPEAPARRLIAVWHRERTLSVAAREFVDTAAATIHPSQLAATAGR